MGQLSRFMDPAPEVNTHRETPAAAPRMDPAEFHALVDRTARKLYRLAARISGNEDDADDILQESYLSAYRALMDRGFDPRASQETWLYGIVTNVALKWIRDAGRAKRRDNQWRPVQTNPAAAAEARVALQELGELLDGLPAEQRVVLVLKELEGITAKEAAAILGISEGAVEQRLVRAREALRTKVRHG
jgi:RNA polymerase sigma-70 factor, ECF subfamily